MTFLLNKQKKCYVCGKTALYSHIVSTNQFGFPDLDTRPPERMRSTMDEWIQCCTNCGYCALDISTGNLKTLDVIKTKKYKKQMSDSNFPELANHFLCWRLFAESEGEYDTAGWAALNAAWACDDHNKSNEATQCRKLAMIMFLESFKKGKRFADDFKSEMEILIDLFRRCGKFSLALYIAQHILNDRCIIHANNLIKFQIDLMKKKDTGCHCCDEVWA